MKHGRRDAKHAEIRDGLRQLIGKGNVRDTADLGDDFPDLVVGYRGRTYLLEVKSGKQARLSPGQNAAMISWRGDAWVRVDSLTEAMAVIGFTILRAGRS